MNLSACEIQRWEHLHLYKGCSEKEDDNENPNISADENYSTKQKEPYNHKAEGEKKKTET